MTPADHVDLAALNMLVAWQKQDPGARAFRIESHRIDGETEWSVLLKSKRWRKAPENIEERAMWHLGATLEQAVSNGLETVFRHKGGIS